MGRLSILGIVCAAIVPLLLHVAHATFSQNAILAYQFVVEFMCAAALVQRTLHKRPSWRTSSNWYCLASLCFLFAEASFNTSFLAGSVESYSPKSAGALCYTGTFVGLAVGNALQFSRRESNTWSIHAIFLLASCHFALQYLFILVPLGPVYFDRLPPIMLPNGYAYSVASAIVGAQCIVFALGRATLDERAFLGSLLALVISDFGARRQIALYQFAHTDVWQCLWAMSIGVLSIIVLRGMLREIGPFRGDPRGAPLAP